MMTTTTTMMNSGLGSVSVLALPWRPSWRIMCSASNTNTDQLRAQLDQLQTEADTARAKANSARGRLMRLSETAENLKRQAAISVRLGKEDEARDLLFQKKKVMEALQKSKDRIEFLDQLSMKLNEAISVKERQLIGNVALDLEVVQEDSSPVRIVSPTREATEDSVAGKESESVEKSFSDNQELLSGIDSQASLSVVQEKEDLEGSLPGVISVGDEISSRLKGITSFGRFLEHLDEQLNKIEEEIATVLRFSTLVLDNKEKTKNFKVQQAQKLLESIHEIRQRVADIRLAEAKTK
ncbi:uncharacterized protein LOC115700951 [Cannabis sativa]|uniref:Uncharacterized protein n=1 Tax=Cannabis sativa TaxID=3483 RepID=A0A7J6G0N6_CANSA|nr:uncharacterized protein LOC115700951 [Cannabis sativa]KAF4376498.1 hypothetical protein F8388_025369 [Cannabis sativa]